jgi:RimJ/RimL family protein N-acetyltransferase
VELKTDVLNEKSRAAMRRIGAVEEGILRRHIVNENGRIRDSVYYSIIKEEWPAVKRALEEKMAR